MMMLSVYRFFELELLITGLYAVFTLIDKFVKEYNYQKEPDLHQLTHPSENPELQVIAHLLIQFKDELSFEKANQFNRLKFISDEDAPSATIARMRFWSRQNEFIILLSENILTAKLPKTDIRALLSIAIAHLVCEHYQRKHEALMFLKDMTTRWIATSLLINCLEMDMDRPNWHFHMVSIALITFSIVLNKSLSVYFKKLEKEADKYAIEHFGVRQDELIRAVHQVGHQQSSGFFSVHHSNQERQTYIKKMN